MLAREVLDIFIKNRVLLGLETISVLWIWVCIALKSISIVATSLVKLVLCFVKSIEDLLDVLHNVEFDI